MHENYLTEKSEIFRSDRRKPSNEKGSSSQKPLSILQAELKRAESSIQSLLQEKETLKSSLSLGTKKKEELFKVLTDYKEAVEKLRSKNLELEKRSDEVNMVRSEIEKVKSQLIKRDEKIEFLLSRNQELEALVAELSSRKEKPKIRESESKTVTRSLVSSLETMVHKVKSNSMFHRVFKLSVSCINTFLELMQYGKFKEALAIMFKFSVDLMKDSERSLARDLSPGLSEIQSTISNNATMTINLPSYHLDEDAYNCDEERIARLNSELKAAIVRSKEVLFNRSVSSSQFKIDYSDHSVRNMSGTKDYASGLDKGMGYVGNTVNSFKNSTTRIPKVEIRTKYGNKTAKIIPKSSILKRSNL